MEQFNFKTAASLLPKLDGKVETVYSLIDGIELYEPSLNEAGKPLLVNYVLKACILHKDKLRLKFNYGNTADLIKDLKTNFLPRQSAPVLAARLQALRQNNMSIAEYATSIESLMSDLTLAQGGSDPNVTEIFKKANEKLAIDVFANGIRSNELRTIIKARGFESLSEAINAAKDESVRVQQQPAVYHVRGQANFRGRGNYQNTKYRVNNNRNNNNFNRNNNNSNRNYSNMNNNNGSHNFNRNSNNRGNYNRGNSRFLSNQGGSSNSSFVPRGRNSENQRVFTATEINKDQTFFRASHE